MDTKRESGEYIFKLTFLYHIPFLILMYLALASLCKEDKKNELIVGLLHLYLATIGVGVAFSQKYYFDKDAAGWTFLLVGGNGICWLILSCNDCDCEPN